ncbi:MAG: cysteine peptidase family C39 domain-containing protein [bacterium]|nr:cysteine peptidase family C39 domain-containing protein [bacterium]
MNKYYVPNATKIYKEQERLLKVDKVGDWKALEDHHRAFKLKVNPRIRKIGKILDKEIWLIDGVKIRGLIRGTKSYPSVDVDFTSGGHGCRYIYSPLNEIWIDDGLKRDDILPTIWHEFTERHLMQRGWSYNEAHERSASVELGIRHGDEFSLPVTNFKQQTNYSCGAVAMRIVLEYLGRDLTERELIKMVGATPENGTDMKDMVALAKSEHFDFKVKWKQRWTPEQVKKFLETGFPMIVNFQHSSKFGEGHYAVIIGYTKDEFIFSDPSGKGDFRKEKINHFMKRWHELEDKTKQEGIVIYW